MPRNRDIPRVNHYYLYCSGSDDEQIKIDSQRWFEWLELEETRSFAFEGYNGYFTARKESKKRGTEYWYAYRWLNGKTKKVYLGASSNLTRDKLNEVARTLSRYMVPESENFTRPNQARRSA
jgi:LuxR family maltose regulon positive regulatory protein